MFNKEAVIVVIVADESPDQIRAGCIIILHQSSPLFHPHKDIRLSWRDCEALSEDAGDWLPHKISDFFIFWHFYK